MPLPVDYISSRNVRPKRGPLVVVAALVYQKWTNPLALDADGYSVSHAGAGAAGTTSMTLGGALTSGGVGKADFPRNVVITVTHATSVVAMNGVITGVDLAERPLTEAWSVTATGTSKTFTGKKAFKRITSITEVVAGSASANSIVAGTGIVFGLEAPMSVASLVKETSAGSVVTNGTLVKASAASTDDPHGTYSPNTTPDAGTSYEAWYISNQPESGR